MIRKPTRIELRQEDDYYEYEDFKRKQVTDIRNRPSNSYTQKSSLVDSSFKVDSFKGFSSPANLSSPQDFFRGGEPEFQEAQPRESQFNQIFSMLLSNTIGGQSPLPTPMRPE